MKKKSKAENDNSLANKAVQDAGQRPKQLEAAQSKKAQGLGKRVTQVHSERAQADDQGSAQQKRKQKSFTVMPKLQKKPPLRQQPARGKSGTKPCTKRPQRATKPVAGSEIYDFS